MMSLKKLNYQANIWAQLKIYKMVTFIFQVKSKSQEQVASTLKKYYSGIDNLILLKVETLKLDHLVWEQASDGNFFPHLYSSLDLINVVKEYEIGLDKEGNHELPKDLD